MRFAIPRPWRRAALLLAAGFVLGGAVVLKTAEQASKVRTRLESKATRLWDRRFGTPHPPAEDWKTDAYEILPHSVGFDFPVRIVLYPTPPTRDSDPFYFVSELPGGIKLVDLAGQVHTVAEGMLDFEWQPVAELGLMGLDIDPSGDSLYATITYWDEDHGVYRNKVEQLILTGSPPTIAERKVLLDVAEEATVPSYGVQFVSVGPDEHLWVGIGAGGNIVDAQDPTKFAGKIIRMDKAGHAAPDNPFYDPDDPTSAASYTWALGFRNPFDLVWEPTTKVAIVSEVGPGIDRILKLERGFNYCFGDGQGESRMRANALYTWGPGGSFAPTGITLADAATYGEGEGELLYLGLFGPVHIPGPNDGKSILRFYFNPAGGLDSGPTEITRNVSPYYSSVTDVVAAHDAIYFADFYGHGEPPHFGNGVIYRMERTAPPDAVSANLLQTVPDDLEGTARGEMLFTVAGCAACHDLGSTRTGKEGPALGGLSSTLAERLGGAEYAAKLDDLSSREGAYFAGHRPEYAALRSAQGAARSRLWLSYHLRDPRFDHPEGKMPAFPQLSEKDVEALTAFLLGG